METANKKSQAQAIDDQTAILQAEIHAATRRLDIINGTLIALADIMAEIAKLYQSQAQAAQGDTSPNYRRKLNEYQGFDWFSIDANPIREDHTGVATVSWGGQDWQRRSGAGTYGEAIWFSRPEGQDEHGANKWLKLITFRDYEDPKPIDPRISQAVSNGTASPPAPHSVPPMPQHQAIPPASPPPVDAIKANFQDRARYGIRQGLIPHTEINTITSSVSASQDWADALVQLNAAIDAATAT